MRNRQLILIAAALGLALPALPAAAAPAGAFLTDAIRGNLGEVAIGRLAERRGDSHAARDFGRTLERDHSAGNVQAMAAARREHVRIPTSPTAEATATERRLRRLSGHAFDRELGRAMVEDHRKDIAKFEAQARSGDRVTRELARNTLPVLRHHLQLAQSLR